MIGRDAMRVSAFAPTSLDKAFELMMDFGRENFTHLMIVPGMLRGGAERAACSYISYLQEAHGIQNVVMLSTEFHSHSVAEWLPEGTRKFDVKNCLSEPLSVDDVAILLASFIVDKKPMVTISSNSTGMFWAIHKYKEYLAECSKFVFLLFGFEAYLPQGFAMLDDPAIRDSVQWADCVITDTKRLRNHVLADVEGRKQIGKVTEECYLTSHHLVKLKTLKRRSAKAAVHKTLLWASRIVPSKRPDILISVATLLPEYKFLAYGSTESIFPGSSQPNFIDQFSQVENIEFRGEYSDFAEICDECIGAFIYTSDSDGVPITLLEAAAAGIPIIAPNVGGISEFLTSESGWLIEDFADVDAYVEAIKIIFDGGDAVSARTERALNILNEQHSQEAFQSRLDLIFKEVTRIR